MDAPVVIVGSGLAGWNLAREFRKLDKQTPLVVVSRDGAGFYSKPMLSNALASNKSAQTLLMKPADKMAAEVGATVLDRTEVLGIDVAARTLSLSDGRTQPWRDLVLALGADPIRLPLAGDAAADVLSVNDLDDYARFADALAGVRRVALLGAGLIGCEFANDLLARGLQPVVLDLADRPLARLLPPDASAWMRARLEAAGVRFLLGASALRVDRATGDDAQGRLRLTLSDGRTLDADLVLSAVGLAPRVALARAAGLAVQRGIVVDRRLSTSVAHIHAIGDCAEVEGLNLPYVMPLMAQARALAATLAGTPTPLVYPVMPVTVKTPACPAVVCPPAPGTAGHWQVTQDDIGCEAVFRDDADRTLGFALLGSATARKAALAAQTPSLLG
ncbi:MAG: NAD(P)/FAD-dependent oxidoreductase [Rubrivivax sp.]